jgi:dipeptidyl aminopeptidase/acylaminoacyl peptidase
MFLLALALTACVPGQAAPTPILVTPPPSAVTPVIITASPTPLGRTAVAPTAAPTAVGTAPGGIPSTTGPSTAPTPRPGTTPAPPAPSAAPPPATASTPNTGIPRAVKLTRDGCCPLPLWLADSSGVIFYGNPQAGDARLGTWRIPRDGGAPQLLSQFYGTFSPDRSVIAYPDGEVTRLARPDGTVLGTVANGGERVYLAATNDRAAWLVPAANVPIVSVSLDPPIQVAIARLDRGEAIVSPPIFISETLQWFPDGRHILVNGRDSRAEHPGLWVLDTVTGAATLILESPWLEAPLISPDGKRIVYTATLQRDQAANGVWIINADGSGRQRLALAGGYRWAPDSQALLYVPAPTNRPGDELWRYNLADGARTTLVSVEQLPFAIAQNDWEVAPDGTAITYRSATDGAIWVLRFAP